MSNKHYAYNEEEKYLDLTKETIKVVLDKINNEIFSLNESIDNLNMTTNGVYSDEIIVKNEVLNSKLKKRNLLNNSLSKPYFGRIDFEELGKDTETFYIGKCSISDVNDNRLVLDWRAPISGLYYSGEIGEVMYKAPGGLIIGDLKLKRQYVIDDSKLISVFDKGITPMDEYLQNALSEKKDNRLKDIVTTIQSEQNDIIRADKDNTVIVQGVAGSGKTTIVLHRIAYLLYTYQNIFTPENILILVPNKLFLNYISDVLPDLGVEDIIQNTYEELIMKLDKEYKLISNEEKILKLLDNTLLMESERENIKKVSKFKGSLLLKEIIDKVILDIESKMVTSLDIKLNDNILYSHEEIKNLFYKEFTYLPIIPRINRIKSYIKDTICVKIDKIKGNINFKYQKNINEVKKVDLKEDELREKLLKIYNERDMILKQIDKDSNKVIIEYFNKWEVLKTDKLYKTILTNNEIIKKYCEDKLDDYEIDIIANYSKEIFNKGYVEKEDLAPLFYTKMKIEGLNTKKFRHIIVDEAQDYSEFEMFILKFLNISNSFTIVGDISQGIHSYRGVSSWDEFIDNVFEKEYVEYLTLKKCYRSTKEIIDLANHIIRPFSDENILGEPVLRFGEKPSMIKISDKGKMINKIKDEIINMTKKGYKSIAIICKLSTESQEVFNKLKGNGMDVDLITDNDIIYNGGIVVIPAHLAKGLEFDGVLIYNCSRDNYLFDNFNAKILYVSVTRALHEAHIYYIDKPSMLLDDYIDNYSD